jgi:hypothetical protein
METTMPAEYPHTQAQLDEHKWVETTEKDFYDMLGAVPPARQSGRAFALGEASCHLDSGGVVHAMYIEVDDKFYTKPDLLTNFNPTLYKKQIQEQTK